MSEKLFYEDDTPSELQDRIRAAKPESWKVVDQNDMRLAVSKLRLVGIYDDRQERWFMLRTRIAGGMLTADQADVIAGVARDYSSRPDGDEDPEHFVEITTRQNIQLHWLLFENLPDVWDRYDAVGLTSLEACGNSLRNVCSCPVAGLASDEWIDPRPAVAGVTRLALEDQRFTAFLPRKFKVAVSGCSTDCVIQHVHCLSFVASRRDGEIGYNMLIGGGLSDYPRLASSANLFLSEDQVVAATRAVLEVFREHGDYEHPAVNRFRMLVHQLGPERTEQEIKQRLPFDVREEGEILGNGVWDDHLGVNADRFGTHFVGLNVPVGRLHCDDLTEVARLARQHGDGNLRLTSRQNLIVTGVSDVDALLREPLLERMKPFPDPFERGIVACTSAPFCKFGILNVKEYGAQLTDHLRRNVDEDKWDKLHGLKIHISGCKASCAQPQLAHIGMRSTMTKDEEDYHDAVDFVLGGTNTRLGEWTDLEVKIGDAWDRTTAMVNAIADEMEGPGAITDEAVTRVLGRMS